MFEDSYLNFLIILFSYIIVFFVINSFLINKKILLDSYQSSKHKKLISNQNVPLSGGLVLLLSIFFFKLEDSLLNYILILIIYLIGLLSDLRILNNPLKRLILQLLVISSYIYINKINISYINILYFDNLLSNNFISLIFTLFCFLILVNGSNFIDGSNLQCTGYYIAVIITLGILINNGLLFQNQFQVKVIFVFMISFAILNIYNKSFLGDGGSYLLSFVVGIISVKFFNLNSVSPYFIALLLWYPAFENLFTIIRRKFFNKKTIDQPDVQHLHQLFIKTLRKKKYKTFVLKNIFGFIVFIFNFILFLIGSMYLYSSKIQILLIIFAVTIYIITYQKLKIFKSK